MNIQAYFRLRVFQFLIRAVFLSFLSTAAAAGSPVAIDCPCNVSRENPTAVEIDFNLIFTQPINESGALEIYLRGHSNRDAVRGSYYVLASAEIESIGFSGSPVSLSLTMPFYFTGFESGYLSLVLVDSASGETLDVVPLTAEPISPMTDAGFTVKIGSGEVFFEQQPSFDVYGRLYDFNAINITNKSNPLGSDNLTLEVTASNLSTYYILDQQDFSLNYDAQGKASVNFFGFANNYLDAPLSYAPEHQYLQIAIYRGDQLLLLQTVAMLNNSAPPDFSFELTQVDTLVDTDGDGVNNYAELLRGSPPGIPGPATDAELEIGFSYGDAALEYYGSKADVEAHLSHLLAVANDAYSDSGVNVSLQKTALVYIGDDRAVINNELLNRMQSRSSPFNYVDALFDRQPDILVHLSTLSFDDTNGGIAWLNGYWNDGVIDFEGIASNGTNTAVVDMDNTAITLVHEIGHIMGLDHSRRQVEGSHFSSFPWALGHGVDAEFVTIMSYPDSYSWAPRLALFSSPQLACTASGISCGRPQNNAIYGADSVSALKSIAFQWTAVANGFAPVLSLVGENPLFLDASASLSNLGATATDAEDGNISAAISFRQSVDRVDPSVDYLQTYTVVDSDNNSSTVIRKVALVTDTDSDGTYNRFDNDDDNDSVIDTQDSFPLDNRYSADSDGDGLPDAWEALYGLDANNPADANSDQDVDGLTALEEFTGGTSPVGSLDIDGNGQYDAYTDGLLVLRYMFGFTGEQLISGSLAPDALYKSASLIEARIDGLGDRMDVDGNNQINALTDGLLILRYLLEFQEGALIDNAVSADAVRVDSTAIEAYLETLKTGG
jgi:hypothetical protein